jgi:hypothetical protein
MEVEMAYDPEFTECETLVALARREVYKVKNAAEKITHTERREILVRLSQELFDKLDQIDSHLKR